VFYGITGKNIKTINEASKLVCGFKLYLGETTGPLVLPDSATQEKAFRAVSETKKTIVVHAEDNALNKKALEANKTKADALAHARSHPPESEADAVKKVIAYAQETKAKTHITHVSTAQAAAVIREGKKNGGTLSCDTSCNYLLLNQTNLAEKGQLLKVTPPLRTPQDQNALWNAIESETIDMIASDHAPHTLDEKTRGVWEAPSGMPGVGLSLPLLLNEVNNKRLALKRLSELVSHNPAKAFSIKNRGYVAEGFYADLILVDMNAEKKVKGTELYSKCGWTPYEGWTLRGWPQTTVVNGNIVYNDGIIFDEKNGVEVQQA
jgi:dihydroorotase